MGKRFSTYKDNTGTFEPSKELDKYGVWVKSDPQVLAPLEDENQAPGFQEKTPESDIFNDIENMEPEKSAESGIPDEPPVSIVLSAPEALPKDAPPAPADAEKPAEAPRFSDASLQVLTNILEEITALRKELTAFKDAVQGRFSVEKPAPYPETIVLAGDELDGIFTAPKTAPAHALGADPVLDHADELQRLREEGHKPLSIEKTEKKSEGKAGSFSLDDLLIETGSMRDIPIDLNQDAEESEDLFEEVNFEPDLEEEVPAEPNVLEPADALEPDILSAVDPEALEPVAEEVLGISELDLNSVIFPEDDIDISDEELDRIERDILLEFSDKLPAIEAVFSQDEQTDTPADAGNKKKTAP